MRPSRPSRRRCRMVLTFCPHSPTISTASGSGSPPSSSTSSAGCEAKAIPTAASFCGCRAHSPAVKSSYLQDRFHNAPAITASHAEGIAGVEDVAPRTFRQGTVARRTRCLRSAERFDGFEGWDKARFIFRGSRRRSRLRPASRTATRLPINNSTRREAVPRMTSHTRLPRSIMAVGLRCSCPMAEWLARKMGGQVTPRELD